MDGILKLGNQSSALRASFRRKNKGLDIEPFPIFFFQFKDVKKVFSKYVKICLCYENVNANEEEEQVKWYDKY